MNIRVISVITLLMVASILSWALPKIEVYRYVGKDFKTLPLDLLTNPQVSLNDWAIDADTLPKDKKILLLVHGFPMFRNGNMRTTMAGLAKYFSQERKIGVSTLPAYDCIYAVDYPMGFSLYETKTALRTVLNQKLSAFSNNQKIDIFNHCMGGLIIRSLIEDPNSDSIAKKVDHVIFMATPHTGFSVDEIECLRKGLDLLPVEMNDLNPESLFMSLFNIVKKPVDCSYYSVVGLRSWAPEQFGKSLAGGPLAKAIKNLQDKNFKVHDGLIGSESAGFNLKSYCKNFKLITLDLNHEYINNHQLVFKAIDKWMIDDKWFGDIQTPTVQPKITKFTGGLPVLLGKTKEDVQKIIGEEQLSPDPSTFMGKNNCYSYSSISTKFNGDVSSVMTIFLIPYDIMTNNTIGIESKEKFLTSSVQIVSYVNIWAPKNGYCCPIGPKRVVPKEILASEPSGICWYDGDGGDPKKYGLVIIWRDSDNTFVIGVKDKTTPLVDIVDSRLNFWGNKGFRVKKNKNTFDFRNTDNIEFFWQIKGNPNFFGKKEDWELNACNDDRDILFENRGKINGRNFYRFFE